MVVPRQGPETAKGIVFMLLEDERGSDQPDRAAGGLRPARALVRAAPLIRAKGKLERREGRSTSCLRCSELERTQLNEVAPGGTQLGRLAPLSD